jgi:tyrosinase
MGVMKENAATLTLSGHALAAHLAADSPASLFALVTLPRPTVGSPDRQFDILVDAPPGVTQVSSDSPYYAGTIAFFGGMMHMPGMSGDATFLVPLPKRKEAFKGLTAANGAEAKSVAVTIRVVPSEGGASVLRSATVRAL